MKLSTLSKSLVLAILLSQPMAQASLSSSIAQFCSNAWQNHKQAISLAVIAATALVVYKLYTGYQAKQAKKAPESMPDQNTTPEVPKADNTCKKEALAPKSMIKRTINLKKYEDHRWTAKPPFKVPSKITRPNSPLATIKEEAEVKPVSSPTFKQAQEQALQPIPSTPRNENRQITFTSTINDSKKGYNLLFMTYNPAMFKVSINGQEIGDGATLTLPITQDKFIIRYDYKFSLIKDPGFREVEFLVDPTSNTCAIDFSFTHENRFIIDQAKFLRIVALNEPGSQYAAKR